MNLKSDVKMVCLKELILQLEKKNEFVAFVYEPILDVIM